MDRQKTVKLAESYAAQGFLCSEAVLLAVSDLLGIRCRIIPQIATGFGAGMGGRGMGCGAVTGAVMGLGMHLGRNEVKGQKRKAYWFAHEVLNRFKQARGHVTCRDLTGCDFTTDEGIKKYEEERIWDTRCRQYIGTAAAVAFDVINEET